MFAHDVKGSPSRNDLQTDPTLDTQRSFRLEAERDSPIQEWHPPSTEAVRLTKKAAPLLQGIEGFAEVVVAPSMAEGSPASGL